MVCLGRPGRMPPKIDKVWGDHVKMSITHAWRVQEVCRTIFFRGGKKRGQSRTTPLIKSFKTDVVKANTDNASMSDVLSNIVRHSCRMWTPFRSVHSRHEIITYIYSVVLFRRAGCTFFWYAAVGMSDIIFLSGKKSFQM